MWQRVMPGDCPDEDEGSTIISDGSTSYDITGLEEGSQYIIIMTASNSAGSSKASNVITEKTMEAGEYY